MYSPMRNSELFFLSYIKKSLAIELQHQLALAAGIDPSEPPPLPPPQLFSISPETQIQHPRKSINLLVHLP